VREHVWQNIEGCARGGIPEFYKVIVDRFPFGSHFVEVGALFGASTSAMLVHIINSGKEMKLDVIDKWDGSVYPSASKDKRFTGWRKKYGDDWFPRFEKNMRSHGMFKMLTPYKMTSEEGSKLYQDESLDFVFLDADHNYPMIKLDVGLWWKKIKSGGILSGHDWRNPGKENGVKRALKEQFGSFHTLENCWWVQKDE